MKKKVLMVLMTTAMIATLVGCGSKETSNEVEDSKAIVEATETVEVEDTETEEVVLEPETEAVEPETEIVAVEPETEAPAPVVQTTMYAQSTVNVRSLPSTDSEIIGKLAVNDPIIVNGDLSADGWYTVTYCDQTAYVKGSLLGMNTVEIKQTTTAKKPSSSGTSTNTTTATNTNTTASQQSASEPAAAPASPQAAAPAETPAPAPAEQPAPQPTPAPATDSPYGTGTGNTQVDSSTQIAPSISIDEGGR